MSLQGLSIRHGVRVIFGVVLLLLLASSIWASPLQQNCATIAFSPTTDSAAPGEVVEFEVLLDTGGETFDTAGFLLHFDPTHLRVVDAAGDPATQVESGDLPGQEVWNVVSNTAGTIRFAQIIIGGQDGGTFTMATIRFEAIAVFPITGTLVTFINGVGNTGVLLGGQQLLCEFPEPATIIGWFNLTTDKTGSGMVTSDPVGILCREDCTEDYVKNTVVTLTAHPNVKSYFVGWSGDCVSTGVLTAQVTMGADKTCTATFSYPVGGIVVPVDKVGLVAPWLGLVAVALLVVALAVVLVRKRKT
jgi:hypothetical protein